MEKKALDEPWEVGVSSKPFGLLVDDWLKLRGVCYENSENHLRG
jgi:hypothetical protein